MKIKYNEIDKSIEIKEELNLKSHYIIIKAVMVLNLITAVINLIIIGQIEFGIRSIFWTGLGIISLVVLYVYIFERTTSVTVPIEKIKRLQERSIFGRKQFYLKLNNGRKRPLAALKSGEDKIELRKLFSEIGIQN